MEFDNKRNSLEQISDQMWRANNYRNGIPGKIKASKNQFNRKNDIRSKEEQRKEILYSTSVKGRVERLNQQIKAVSNPNNHRI